MADYETEALELAAEGINQANVAMGLAAVTSAVLKLAEVLAEARPASKRGTHPSPALPLDGTCACGHGSTSHLDADFGEQPCRIGTCPCRDYRGVS